MVGRVFLGRYEAIRLLGEGGMGRVYLARQMDLGRQVVVKVMHDHIAADPNFRKRFERETLLMARFQNPFVVTLFDASLNDPEGPCIVMEYINGITLDTVLQRNNRLSAARVGRLLGQLCEALFAAHTQEIIHRDLKPANLMVIDSDSPYEKIKVMDFGLAKLVDKPNRMLNKDVTNNDFAVGTPAYISPEQVRGDDMDHRSDLYSVGVMLFELLTGRLPFNGTEEMDVLLAHATQAPPSFDEAGACGQVPPAVEAVVRRCLAKDPKDRPSTARDLAQMYHAALEGGEMPGAECGVRSAECEAEAAIDSENQAPNPDLLNDPFAMAYELEAWMPDAIATHKLRGFVEDAGGEVVESVPGRILVRLGTRGSVYYVRGAGPLGWLGIGSRHSAIDMELSLQRIPDAANLVRIMVTMRSSHGKSPPTDSLRERCGQVFCDLRAYLMGQGVSVG